MGCCGKLFKCSAVLVAFVAVGVGLGLQKHVWGAIDNSQVLRGMFPALHQGTPFGFVMDDIPEAGLQGKTVVVTGANVGLGYWTAHHIASKGAHVVMCCRTASKCQVAVDSIKKQLPTASLEPASLDLNSFKSVKAFSESFASKHSNLHSLVLNAGIMVPPFTLTADGIESQIGVNHFSHFLLTKLLLPVLTSTATAASPVTVVAVSSAASFQAYPEGVRLSLDEMNNEATYSKQDAYGQSKLANILFAQELAEQVKGKHILVNAIHPGGVQTELWSHALTSIDAGLSKISPAFAKWFTLNMVETTIKALTWTPEVAALTQIYTAVGPQLLKERTTGQYFHPIARLHKPPDHASDSKLQKGLWQLSEKVLASKGY